MIDGQGTQSGALVYKRFCVVFGKGTTLSGRFSERRSGLRLICRVAKKRGLNLVFLFSEVLDIIVFHILELSQGQGILKIRSTRSSNLMVV